MGIMLSIYNYFKKPNNEICNYQLHSWEIDQMKRIDMEYERKYKTNNKSETYI